MRKLVGILLFVASGCGGVSVDKACTDFAESFCGKINGCAAPLITAQYGDVTTCQARLKLTCPSSLMAANSSATPDRLDKCASEASTLSCEAVFTRDAPADCRPEPGKLANGMACGDDAQCVSAFCKRSNGDVCGVCGMRGTAGAACSTNDDCDFKLACANGVCVTYSAVGGSCDASHPCVPPNICKNAVCTVPVGAGGSCDPIVRDCDATAGLYCHPTARVCMTVTFAAAGGACGFVNNTFVGCSASGHCKVATGMIMGTCLAAAADGAACDATNGPECTPPASCVNGVCKLPNPASCM